MVSIGNVQTMYYWKWTQANKTIFSHSIVDAPDQTKQERGINQTLHNVKYAAIYSNRDRRMHNRLGAKAESKDE
jgi:hypothetical protein